MNPLSTPPELAMFSLLVPATGPVNPDIASIEVCGRRWELVWFDNISDAPPFTCISYSWGPGRIKSPFENGKEISDRTVRVIETAIAATQSRDCWSDALESLWRDELVHAEKLALAIKASEAFWIDSFCLPSEPIALEKCLRSMGDIYRLATQVLAVFIPGCSNLFKKVRCNAAVNYHDLLVIESDDWISRVWTYQEIANSQAIYFVAEGDGSVLLNHQELLIALVNGAYDWADAPQGIGRNNLAAQFPRLDSLESLFVEQQILEYNGRSVFQVLGAMQNRHSRDEPDRIHAILGVVTDKLSNEVVNTNLPLAEYFMRVCEEKADFSFIFAVGPRSVVAGRTWRPVGERFPAILSGLVPSGTGLSASLKETHLEMHNMSRLNGDISNPVLSAIAAFTGRSFPKEILEQLRKRGFTGSGDCLDLEQGYFFPQLTLPPKKELKDMFVAISNDVIFAQGGPGLLLRPVVGTEMNQFCDIGVFIGRIPNESVTINMC